MTSLSGSLTPKQMLYQAYNARRALAAPIFGGAGLQSATLSALPRQLQRMPHLRMALAVADTTSALELTHRRPAFGIGSTILDGADVPVVEEAVDETAFGSLVHFAKRGHAAEQPRVLVVPGLAGHFATLLRGTVRTLLPDNDVFVADWHNARDIPVEEGRFGLDEYIDHLIRFLEAIGGPAHLMAVCQPCVPALAAAAIMSADGNPSRPASVILMAGPVDARIEPGRVNEIANSGSLDFLERTVIATVPRPYRGYGRRVYPGFLQLMGFVGLAPRRHMSAFARLFADVALGDSRSASRTKEFYEEYFAVLDVTAEFFLETAQRIFRDHDLALGQFDWHGRRVHPAAIDTALLTIEAGNDEMCPPGQTYAAHDLCTGIPAERRHHHLQEGVGHYGVFSGSRFEHQIYPVIRDFVAAQPRAA